MRFLALNRDRAAALAQFETCRHLAEEPAVEPSPETVRLAAGSPRRGGRSRELFGALGTEPALQRASAAG